MSNYLNPMSRTNVTVSISDLVKDHSRIIYDIDSTGIILNRIHNIILWHNITDDSFDCGMYADTVTDIHSFHVSADDKAVIMAL